MRGWLSVGCRSQNCDSFPLLSSLNNHFWPEGTGSIVSVIQARYRVVYVRALLMVSKTKVIKDCLNL